MRELNDISRIFILFNLREVREASRAFSFILDELNINYKLVNSELSVNNTLFKYVTILASKSSIRNKSRASGIRNL